MDFKELLMKTIFFAITVVILYLVKLIVKKIVKRIFKKRQMKKPNKGKRLVHFEKLAIAALNIVFAIVVVLIVLQYTGLSSVFTALITFAGVGSLVIGLAAQDIFKDIIAGFLLVSEDNFAHDDYIEINGYEGTVEDIKLRNIYLRTYSGQLVAIPSGEINTIINYSRGEAKALCFVNIPSRQNIQVAVDAIKQAGDRLSECEPKVRSKAVIDGITEIDKNSYKVRAYVISDGVDYFYVQRKFYEFIINEFVEKNIDFTVGNKQEVYIKE